MSSFKAKLFINGEERNLLQVKQTFSQYFDTTGRPTTKPIGNSLFFTVESTGNDSFFYHNMFSPNNMIDGEIVFYKRDGFSTLYKIEFAEAHIIGLRENFDHDDNLPLHMIVEIGWSIIKIKGLIVQEYWNQNNPFEEIAATTIEDEEPEIISLRYLDEEGNEVTEFYEDVIYLEIQSKNCIGKLVDIDLSDDEFDFSFNGEHLENDLLEDLEIKADLQKIKLEVYYETAENSEEEETAEEQETVTA